MNRSIEDLYFDWLINLVCQDKFKDFINLYSKLLHELWINDFTWSIPLDSNRDADAIGMRNDFLSEFQNYPDDLYFKSCSIFEMMVALSIRIERDIMSDPRFGDRTSEWFWRMIDNMELREMTDENYDEDYVYVALTDCIDRRYDYDGTGGFFRIPDIQTDMRDVEIWYQMLWYLDYIIENEGE